MWFSLLNSKSFVLAVRDDFLALAELELEMYCIVGATPRDYSTMHHSKITSTLNRQNLGGNFCTCPLSCIEMLLIYTHTYE